MGYEPTGSTLDAQYLQGRFVSFNPPNNGDELVWDAAGHQWLPTAEGAAAAIAWGAITGTLSNQTDLNSALIGKVVTTTTVNGHALSSNVTVTPTDLSLVIGTNVQAWDTDLDTWATKTPYAGTVVVTTGKTFTNTNNLTLTATDGSTLAIGGGGTLGSAAYTASSAYDAAGAAAAVTPTTLGLVIGTNVQAYDADLTTWAGITPGTGVGTFLATPSSANLRAALTDENGTGAALFDGATSPTFVTPALGTPSAIVLTNASGTASININGTVGATTPTTGAFTSETFTLSLKSTTALATPSALSATQFTGFASTVSGAAIMGMGTTNDVSLMNRAGTVVLGIGPNTTAVNIPAGPLTVGPGGTGADTAFIYVDSGSASGGNASFNVRRNGVNKIIFGVAGSTGSGVTGSAVNDSYFRGAQRVMISADDGTTNNINILGSTGLVTITGTLSVTGASTLTGAVTQGAKTITYNNIATEGNGMGAIVKATRVTAQTSNVTVATYTTPASDGSYLVSGNINITAAIAISTSLNCDYTDETNTARTMIIPISGLGGSFLAGGLATGTGPFESSVMHIRTKASTAITIYTAAGTFTSATYNAEGVIRQLQ